MLKQFHRDINISDSYRENGGKNTRAYTNFTQQNGYFVLFYDHPKVTMHVFTTIELNSVHNNYDYNFLPLKSSNGMWERTLL